MDSYWASSTFSLRPSWGAPFSPATQILVAGGLSFETNHLFLIWHEQCLLLATCKFWNDDQLCIFVFTPIETTTLDEALRTGVPRIGFF